MFVTAFFRLFGWNGIPEDTKDLIRSTTATRKNLLLIYPHSSKWDLQILLSFLWSAISGCNWFVIADELPFIFWILWPMKSKVAGKTAWCLRWSGVDACDVYIQSENELSGDLGEISQTVGVVGPNYHPEIRCVHAAAQSAKYTTSSEYIPYYLTQFVRLNNRNKIIATPTYIRKRGITYKSCATGKTLLAPFDPMCLAYFTNIVCSILVAFHNLKLAAISAALNGFLLFSRAHSASNMMATIVMAKIALECVVSSSPGTIFSCMNLMLQAAVLFWTMENEFSWNVAVFNRHFVSTISVGLSMIIHTFAKMF
jgi:hypothetical protein